MGEAIDVGASMIRLALHQTDLTVSREHALCGSTTERVLRDARCPVLSVAGNRVAQAL